MKTALLLLAALLSAAAQTGRPRIVLVGDSTVTDAAGWGTGFRDALPGAECVNASRGGTSTLSYRTAGLWEKALAAKGQYMVIQFGHNDVPGKGPRRETDAATTFRDNLARYIREARAAGAKPVLATSVVHRRFDGEGRFVPDKTLAPYAEAARAVAEAERVPLMDLFALTAALCDKLGKAGCEAHGRMAKDKEGVESMDATHYGEAGAKEIGGIVAAEFARVVPEASAWLRGR